MIAKQFEQTSMFDPTNPNQVIREQYAQIPGGYGSWYYNRVPVSVKQLSGVGLGDTFDTLPGWAQLGLVAALGTVAGYFGMKHFSGGIKKSLHLSGARHRRGRR